MEAQAEGNVYGTLLEPPEPSVTSGAVEGMVSGPGFGVGVLDGALLVRPFGPGSQHDAPTSPSMRSFHQAMEASPDPPLGSPTGGAASEPRTEPQSTAESPVSPAPLATEVTESPPPCQPWAYA